MSKVLTRYRVPLLGHIDLNTGVRVWNTNPVCDERDNSGDLIHVDVKKVGQIPDGVGHHSLGRQSDRKNWSGVGCS